MDVTHPMRMFGSSIEAEVLEVLGRGASQLTGRQVHRMLGDRSYEGVRRALDRLVSHGIVRRTPAGRAYLHELDRRHMAAPAIEMLANLRGTLIERMRGMVRSWGMRPALAAVYGSVARGDSAEASDVDIFVVRPHGIDVDDVPWRTQVESLETAVHEMTGNDVRILERSVDDLDQPGGQALLADIAADGVALDGSLSLLGQAARRRT